MDLHRYDPGDSPIGRTFIHSDDQPDGIDGLDIRMAVIRLGGVTPYQYYNWVDGWTTSATWAAMTDQNDGVYTKTFDHATADSSASGEYLVKYRCFTTGHLGTDCEVWSFTTAGLEDIETMITTILRILRNKMEIRNSYLRIYDDNGQNVILQARMLDKDQSGIVLQGTGPVDRNKLVAP